MPLIAIGGVPQLVEVEEVPATAAELNLGNQVLRRGVYRLTRKGAYKSGGREYPFFAHTRVADLPEGANPLPMIVIGC